jgi:hypothetical protein
MPGWIRTRIMLSNLKKMREKGLKKKAAKKES